MATLIITEYQHPGVRQDDGNRVGNLALEPAIAEQSVSFTTATQSSAFNDATRVVRLQADAACNVKFGSNPTATASHQPLSAGVEYWRAVKSGDKVSVYDGSS